LLYLTKGGLPWENFKGKDTLENLRFVTEKKESTKIEALTRGLPSKDPMPNLYVVEYHLFYNYCRKLEFIQTPDYGYLHRLLRTMIYQESFKHQIAFQWIKKETLH